MGDALRAMDTEVRTLREEFRSQPASTIDWTTNIAAELDAILAHIAYVKDNAGTRLDGPENHEIGLAYQQTRELIIALRS